MPWDTDQMFLRRKAGSSFSTWLEVVHSANITTFTKSDVLKYPNMSLDTRFFRLGRFNLPNGGNQATITTNACNGYGTNSQGQRNSFTYYIPNCQMPSHVYIYIYICSWQEPLRIICP